MSQLLKALNERYVPDGIHPGPEGCTRVITPAILKGLGIKSEPTLGGDGKPTPNIIHIFTDDLGWQDVACYYRQFHSDEPLYETPNLDRMERARVSSAERSRRLCDEE